MSVYPFSNLAIPSQAVLVALAIGPVEGQHVWYSRRPEVAEMARRATMADVQRFRDLAGKVEPVSVEPGTGKSISRILASVADELELRLSGARFVELGPKDPCPDPDRLFDL